MLLTLPALLLSADGSYVTYRAVEARLAQTPIIAHGGWQYPRTNTPDSMAPRPDAPVYSLIRPAAAPQAPATAGGARYYSIHRQAGRTPDTPNLPEPVYLDALPVQLDSIPTGEDLATPPTTPQFFRDAQGRLRPFNSSEDPQE